MKAVRSARRDSGHGRILIGSGNFRAASDEVALDGPVEPVHGGHLVLCDLREEVVHEAVGSSHAVEAALADVSRGGVPNDSAHLLESERGERKV